MASYSNREPITHRARSPGAAVWAFGSTAIIAARMGAMAFETHEKGECSKTAAERIIHDTLVESF